MRAISKLRLVTVVALVAVAGVAIAATREQAPRYETGPGTVPDDVLQRALSEAQSYDGDVEEVYQRARADVSYWREVEPGNARGREDEPGDASVYAVFFEGDFVVHGPVATPGEPPSSTRYGAGRVLLGPDGSVISIQLWEEPKDADPPFGPAFDDG